MYHNQNFFYKNLGIKKHSQYMIKKSANFFSKITQLYSTTFCGEEKTAMDVPTFRPAKQGGEVLIFKGFEYNKHKNEGNKVYYRTQRMKDLKNIVCNYNNSLLNDYIATIVGFYNHGIAKTIIIIFLQFHILILGTAKWISFVYLSIDNSCIYYMLRCIF